MTFTIEQIRNYLVASDSFGDCLYFLSEESIMKANGPKSDIDEDLEIANDRDLEFEKKLNNKNG